MASILQTYTKKDFQRVKGSGKTERFIDLITGKEVSRRYRDEAVNRITYEKKALANKVLNEEEQLARPAKGRTSASKLAPAIKSEVAKVRKEERERKAQVAALEREQRAMDRRAQQLRGKRVNPPKVINGSLLRAGTIGRRINFNNYAEYLDLFEKAKKSRIVFLYGLGWTGIDLRTSREQGVTVFPMRDFGKPISESKFNGEFQQSVEEKSYMEFLHYWMHLAFDVKYARDKAKKAGARKPKNRK